MGLWFWISTAAALLFAAFWALRRRPQAADGPAAPPAAPSPVERHAPAKRERFHAVAIRHGLESCDAAVKMAGQRFLARNAPPLPLPACDAKKCTCRYVHHVDRRTPHDRRNPWSRHGGFDPRKGHLERRGKATRRQRPWRLPRQP